MSNVTPISARYARFLGEDQSDLFGDPSPVWIDADPWDEAAIPRRPWVAPGYLMRGAVTVLSGPGSAGKSMLTIAMAVAIALGRRLGRFCPAGQGKVLVYNVEDDADEQRRRLSAALRAANEMPHALGGRIIRIGPNGPGALVRRDQFTGRLVPTGAWNELERQIQEHRPSCLFLDPFVELHDADENENTSVRQVMGWFRALAIRHELAACLCHHSRKGIAGMAGDPDTLRGASAIVGAARVVLTLMVMDDTEAKKLGIADDKRRDYFRLDGAKSNYAPTEAAEWFRRAEHLLDNGETVAAAVPWAPPSVWQQLSAADCNAALDRIGAGPGGGTLYTATRAGRDNTRWAGQVLVQMFGLNDEQAALVITTWLKNGLLVANTYRDPIHRKDRSGLVVVNSKRPE